ncbi:cell wall-binding repeat-containing protein [Lagierella sp. ICN-221743]
MKKKKIILALGLTIALASTGYAKDRQFTRISGSNRFQTAVEISKRVLDSNELERENKTVVLANGYSFIDALPGGVLANSASGTLLLTNQGEIPKETMDEINRINPNVIYILGGNSSISEDTEEKLKQYVDNVIRLGGKNRYETSELISEEISKHTDVNGYLVASEVADAVASSSLAKGDKPLILVNNNSPSTYLKEKEAPKTVLGGKSSVSENTFKYIDATKRISGINRFETSLNISKASGYKNTALVNGYSFIDGLAAGTLSFKKEAAIILTDGKNLDSNSREFLNKSESIYVVGGKNSVDDGVVNPAAKKEVPKNKTSFEYFDYFNNYSRDVIYTEGEIDAINKKNISLSPYMFEPFEIKAKEYGYIAKRTVLKKKPLGKSFRDPATYDDYNAETGLFPWDEVAIKGYSKDQSWANVVCADYEGWIPKKDIMIVSKDNIKNIKSKSFVTITSRQIKLKDGRYLDMGTYLPLVSEEGNFFKVLMPVAGNTFKTTEVTIKNTDAVKGYMPFTQANVIAQSLKFQGEKYGWGHSNNTRDCSGFIRDVYRSFGIKMARNASAQETDVVGKKVNFKISGGNSAKEKLLKKQNPGSALYMPGHTVMYLGVNEQGIPMMVHSYGYHYVNGKRVSPFINAVSSTRLENKGRITFLESSSTLKDFLVLK